MGIISSRFNFEALPISRRRGSQQGEALYSYSMNKNHFSNHFLMGGERFEVSDPEYLFGDNCDLNFLTCTKPHRLPYKQAQQNLLASLNTKQKTNKASGRIDRLSSPFNILTGRHRQIIQNRKQDAQTQTLSANRSSNNGLEPTQPLVMLINIRKETLRLVKSNNPNIDHDSSRVVDADRFKCYAYPTSSSLNSQEIPARPPRSDPRRHSTKSNCASVAERLSSSVSHSRHRNRRSKKEGAIPSDKDQRSDSDSMASTCSSVSNKSGYRSVRDVCLSEYSQANDDDEEFVDALNDTVELSSKYYDDDDSEMTQQNKSFLKDAKNLTKENRDNEFAVHHNEDTASISNLNSSDKRQNQSRKEDQTSDVARTQLNVSRTDSIDVETSSGQNYIAALGKEASENTSHVDRVYNIQFEFDSEVDCCIRIFYFCTREITSSGIIFKPLHAAYKSKNYSYKKGLNQKFEQQEHTFQPHLFDEDLLIYKPLDVDGNYNTGSVFPIVIQCSALDGPQPRQSHSLVATVEKSQLDESYSIKPLKQLIYVDGVQYILQDIYGIENKQLLASGGGNDTPARSGGTLGRAHTRGSLRSLKSGQESSVCNINFSDTASLRSCDSSIELKQHRVTGSTNDALRSLNTEHTFECVICMSDERDTMLLPCRHLCLCSSCAQSLRYQSSSCPICRCPFKAALNLRVVRSNKQKSWSASSELNVLTGRESHHKTADSIDGEDSSKQHDRQPSTVMGRRDSAPNPTTPLLCQSSANDVVLDMDGAISPSSRDANQATNDDLPDMAPKGSRSELRDARRNQILSSSRESIVPGVACRRSSTILNQEANAADSPRKSRSAVVTSGGAQQNSCSSSLNESDCGGNKVTNENSRSLEMSLLGLRWNTAGASRNGRVAADTTQDNINKTTVNK